MGVKVASWIIGGVLGVSIAVFITNVIGFILGLVATVYFAKLFQRMSVIEVEDEHYI